METVTAPVITYRKTQRGQWVACGPPAAITAGTTVTVTRRDGTGKSEYITGTGRPFSAGGQVLVYGYLGAAPAASLPVCVANPGHCPRGCATEAGHNARAEAAAARLNAALSTAPAPLAGRCRSCRCHSEAGAGQPGTALYDGCDRCGCQAG